jgi:hypothetical protein
LWRISIEKFQSGKARQPGQAIPKATSKQAKKRHLHQGREFIANGALENGAFCTVFSENFHKF